MLEESLVFDSVRRGYLEFAEASNEEIIDYFSAIEPESAAGHASHIKGILFEQAYVDVLATQGIEAQIFEATNHPITDLAILQDGEVINELQLKATDSAGYVNAAIEDYPDVDFVVTSEVVLQLDSELVIDSGIENAVLDQAVSETLFSEAASPFSVIGWLFGLPF